ncbi:MAG: hypothetical protein ACREB9_02850 [Thermoplasmata archaeon]
MSDHSVEPDLAELRRRVLNTYDAITALMLLGIAILTIYVVEVGPLTSPGAQESFGLALGLMFIMGAVLFHLVDRTYRSWPLGRHFQPTPPGPVSEDAVARFLRIFTVVVAGSAIAYLLTVGLIL